MTQFRELSLAVWAFVLRQGLDDEVEPQPQTPTVMVKSDRKYERHHEEYDEHIRIIGADNQQAKETNHENKELRRDDVGENRAHEKAVLTLKKREAVRAVMPDVKRRGHDLGFATGRTKQS